MEGRVQFSRTKDEKEWVLGRSSHFGRWKLLVLKVWVLKNFRFRPILDGARQHRRLLGAEMEERRRRTGTPQPGPLPNAEKERTPAAHLRRFWSGNGRC